MPIIIDTSVFCAFANLDDLHHKKAVKIIDNILTGEYGRVITTDYIFDETVTVAMRKVGKGIAVQIGNALIKSDIVFLVTDEVLFKRTWDIFENTENLSFTDCNAVAFMKLFEIDKIATFDKGFKDIEGIKVIDG